MFFLPVEVPAIISTFERKFGYLSFILFNNVMVKIPLTPPPSRLRILKCLFGLFQLSVLIQGDGSLPILFILCSTISIAELKQIKIKIKK